MTDLTCPKCRTKNLRAPSSGTPVLRCYNCHGMWLTREEASELASVGAISDPASMLPQKASGDAIAGMCPSGHGILIRARVEVDEPFYLERCGRCGGLWFDAGEWTKLASSHLIHHLDQLWDPEWQRKMRRERAEQREREQARALIGEALFDQIEALLGTLESSPNKREAIGYLLGRLR